MPEAITTNPTHKKTRRGRRGGNKNKVNTSTSNNPEDTIQNHGNNNNLNHGSSNKDNYENKEEERMMITSSSTKNNATADSSENVKKRRRRGKRGGEKKKVKLDDPENEQDENETPDKVVSLAADSNENEDNEVESQDKSKHNKSNNNKKYNHDNNKRSNLNYAIPSEYTQMTNEEKEASNQYREPEMPTLSQEIKDYLTQIEEKLKLMDFENDEDKDIFLRNVFRELFEQEAEASTDPDGSRILEKILTVCNDFYVRKFFHSIFDCFKDLMCHQFGSHVCQTLITIGISIIDKEVSGANVVAQDEGTEENEDGEEVPSMQQLMIDLIDRLESKWSELLKNRYGSHVFRAIILALKGKHPSQEEKRLRSKKSQTWKANEMNMEGIINKSSFWQTENREYRVPAVFAEKLNEICESIESSLTVMEMRRFAFHVVAGPMFQMLMETNPEKFLKFIYKEEENSVIDQEYIRILSVDKKGSHTLEVLFKLVNDETFKFLIEEAFANILPDLCMDRLGNYVVQSLIFNARNKEQFEFLYEKIIFKFDKQVLKFCPGVVVKIFAAAQKFHVHQKDLRERFFLLLDLKDSDQNIFKSILCLKNIENVVDGKFPLFISLHGSLILQSLLEFHYTMASEVVESLISLEDQDFETVCLHMNASRVVEMVFTSNQVPRKIKIKLSEKIILIINVLAADKSASHIVDKCWSAVPLEIKGNIAEAMVKNRNQIVKSMYGVKCLRNCRVEEYKRNKDEWLAKQRSIEKKKRMMNELFE